MNSRTLNPMLVSTIGGLTVVELKLHYLVVDTLTRLNDVGNQVCYRHKDSIISPKASAYNIPMMLKICTLAIVVSGQPPVESVGRHC